MPPSFRNTFVLIAFLAVSGVTMLSGGKAHADECSVEQKVRDLLSTDEFKENERAALVKLGKAAFPTYRNILSSTDSARYQVIRVLVVLNQLPEKPTEFVKLTVSRLSDDEDRIVIAAAVLLARIGSVNDASPLVALLHRPEEPVSLQAAKSLGLIGGSREKVALVIWQKTSKQPASKKLTEAVQRAIEKIENRLTGKRNQKRGRESFPG